MRIRSANSADLPFLAWAMLESMLPGVGHGIFDAALAGSGISPSNFHVALLASHASNWGELEDFLILESDHGRSLGAAAAYTPKLEDLRPLTAKGFKRVSDHIGWSADVARGFWRRYISVFGVFGAAPQLYQPADYVIEYVAVQPEERGKGLVRALLDGHAQRARSQQRTRLGISAMVGNEAARRAYLRYGFGEHSTLGGEQFGHAFPGMMRLVLDLNPGRSHGAVNRSDSCAVIKRI